MNNNDLHAWVFWPEQVKERHPQLEAKRLQYWAAMKDPAQPWAHITDLVERHNQEYPDAESFKLLYYKFYILSNVMLAYEVAEKRIRSGFGEWNDYYVPAIELAVDLGPVINHKLDYEIFAQACEHINDYVTGVRPLE
jgi:hypothetical protein